MIRYLAELARWLQRHAYQKRHDALQEVLRRGKELTRAQVRKLSPLEVKPMQSYEAAKLPRPPRR